MPIVQYLTEKYVFPFKYLQIWTHKLLQQNTINLFYVIKI